MRKLQSLLAFVVLFAISSCNPTTPTPNLCTIQGNVPGGDDVPVWLMLVVEEEEGEGFFVDLGDGNLVAIEDSGISTQTDAEGNFTLINVPPNKYVLMSMTNGKQIGPYVLRYASGAPVVLDLFEGEVSDVKSVSIQK